MARYALRQVGVYDTLLLMPVTPGTLAWNAYLAWLAAGNVPDPMPVTPHVPTQAELDAQAELAARETMRTALRADATIQFLRTHTPAEAATYASNAITDLASAKVVIGKLTMVVAYLARERLAGQ